MVCYEKSAFYKYFLRTKESVMLDFNKKGHLVFLSSPLTSDLKYSAIHPSIL